MFSVFDLISYTFAIFACGVAYLLGIYVFRLIEAGWDDAVYFHKNDSKWNVRQNLNSLDYRRAVTMRESTSRITESQGSERYRKW